MKFEHWTDPETGIEYWWCNDCGDERYGTEIQEQIEANGSFEGICFECIQDNFNSTKENN